MRQVLGFVAASALLAQVNQISAMDEEIERINKARARTGNVTSYLRSNQSNEFDKNEMARNELDQVGKDAAKSRVFRALGHSQEPNQYDVLQYYYYLQGR